MAIELATESAADRDVLDLVERHLAFCQEVTPAGGVFALDPDALRGAGTTIVGARLDGRLVGIAVLQEIGDVEAELKTMHILPDARRHGVGRAVVGHILGVAKGRGYRTVRLETGNFDAFASARALYASCGFVPCDPYGPYVGSPTSACMAIHIEAGLR